MLTLILKKKWFDMIVSGYKKEEYRALSPYYTTRFVKVWGGNFDGKEVEPIAFRNGYAKNAPRFVAQCSIDIGEGRQEWGATAEVKYYRLKIREITEINNGR